MLRLAAVERLRGPAVLHVLPRNRQCRRFRPAARRQGRQPRRQLDRRRLLEQAHACHRTPAHLGPLGVDDLPADVIESHRVGGEEQPLVVPGAPRLVPATRATLVDTDQPVEDVQRRLLAGRHLGHRRRDERVALVRPADAAAQVRRLRRVAAGDVVVHAVRQVFQGQRHAG